VAKQNKPTLSKHDLVRGIKELTMQIQMLHRHVMMMDNVIDKYIRMNGDEDKLKQYMEDVLKKEKNEQDTKHKQSRRSAKTSK
jgi:nitrogen fixation/metabolism regulation signal transduction histidine kinase